MANPQADTPPQRTRRQRRKKPRTPIVKWGGFCDGELHIYGSDDGGAIFNSRRAARAQYCDVRRIEISEVPRNG
jgi:hypothetical protein